MNKDDGRLYWWGVEGRVLFEMFGSNNDRHIYFGGQRIARRKDSGLGPVQYYFGDHLGSARVVTDSAGIILDENDFYPFGGETNQDTFDNNYKFTGQERDFESGLDYFIARHYFSSWGRFLQTDPIGGFVELPQSLNRYTYVLNDPTNLTDPSGLLPTGFCIHPDRIIVPCPAPPGDPRWLTEVRLCALYGICRDGDEPRLPRDPQRGRGGGPGNTGTQGEGVFGCAARNANEFSIASLFRAESPVARMFLSNTFSSITQLTLGPNRSEQIPGLAVTALSSPAVNVSARVVSGIEVSPGVLSILRPVPATTLGQTAIGGLLVGFTKGVTTAGTILQLTYDAGAFGGALAYCIDR